MPPRHAYWTILVDDQPTAFRAHDAEELLPTLNRLKEKNPSAVMKWFERGQLFDSRDAARDAGGGEGERRWEGPRPGDDGERLAEAAGRARHARSQDDSAAPPRRSKTWRPGGEHKDPRQKYVDAKKAKWNRFKQNIRDRADRRDKHGSNAVTAPVEPQTFSPPHGDPLRDQIDDAAQIDREDFSESADARHSEPPSRPHGDKLREKAPRPDSGAEASPEWRARNEHGRRPPPSENERGPSSRPWERSRERDDRGGTGGKWRPSGPPRDGDDDRGRRDSSDRPWQRDSRGGGDSRSDAWKPGASPRGRDDRGAGSGGRRPTGPPGGREDDRRNRGTSQRPWQNRDSRGDDDRRGGGWRPNAPRRDWDDRGAGSSSGWRPSGPPRDRDDNASRRGSSERPWQNRDSRTGGDNRQGGWRPSGPPRDRDDNASNRGSSERPWQNRDSRGGGENRGGGWRPSGPARGRDDRGSGSSGGWRPRPDPDDERRSGPPSDRPWQNRDRQGGGEFGDRKPSGGFGKRPWDSRSGKPATGFGPRKPWGAKPGGSSSGSGGGFSPGGRKPWNDRPGRPPAGGRPPKRRREDDE